MPQLHQESDLLADHISDHVLVARASSGDAIAFETIVRRHNQALFRAAHSIVADFAIAQGHSFAQQGRVLAMRPQILPRGPHER